MLPRLFSFFLLLCFVSPVVASDDDQGVTLKAKLKQLVELRQATLDAENDEQRKEANAKFRVFLRDALQHPESFETDFDTIPAIGDLRSGDGFFRMINWNLPHKDQTNDYYCFVQFFDKKDDVFKVIELETGYRGLSGEFRKVFSEKDWYGALYYQIVPSKGRGRKKKRTYMILGWQGKDQYSSLKVIDVMRFTRRGIRFGQDIFDYPYEKNVRRFILEYKADASVSLRYDQRKKRFIFNQLVPMQPDLEGMYAFYIPILEFNAFEWKRRKWTFVEDVEVKMERKEERQYNFPPEAQNLR